MKADMKRFKVGDKIVVTKLDSAYPGTDLKLNKEYTVSKLGCTCVHLEGMGDGGKNMVYFTDCRLADFEVGDIVTLNREATIEDLVGNSWSGTCSNSLDFLKTSDEGKEFEITELNYRGNCKFKERTFETGTGFVNKKLLKLVKKAELKKEMSIEDIEKELGYPIKVVK